MRSGAAGDVAEAVLGYAGGILTHTPNAKIEVIVKETKTIFSVAMACVLLMIVPQIQLSIAV